VLVTACAPAPVPEPPAAPLASEPSTAPASVPPSAAPPAPEPTCASDDACGYDPKADRCVADPRANRQPPIVDQGIVCFCEQQRCGTLRVPPVPCEKDASCAVRADPRPHPVAAEAAHPHEHGKPCIDFVFSTTCERTNICTMHRLSCRRRP
jgi:hypothetical protein